MKKFLRPFYLLIAATVLLVVLCAVLFLRGCSSGPKGPSFYSIGFDPSFDPFDVDGKGRDLAAFVDELLNRIVNQENLYAQAVHEGSAALFPDLRRGALDGVITAETPAETLAAGRYLFSDPIYDFGPVLVVRPGSQIKSLNDLQGKILGLLQGSKLASELALDPTILVISYGTQLQAIQRLIDNTVDAILLPFFPAYVYSTSLFKGQIRIASTPVAHDALRLVVLRKRRGTKLAEAFDKGLEQMHRDGSYDELLKRWGLPNPQNP